MLSLHWMHYIVKKTLKVFLDSQNNYVVKVKANQPTLLGSIKEIIETSSAVSSFTDEQTKRGRKEKRITKVYLPSSKIPDGWPGLNRIIQVERSFESKKCSHQTKSYYISSLLSNDANLFSAGIRGHWLIENKLHWVKDVIQKEDTTRHKSGSAAKNMSILRKIAINIIRENGYESVKYATLFFARNVNELNKIFHRT